MNILYVSLTQSGCSRWRAEIPAKYLKRRGHTVKFFTDGNNECPDVFVFFRQYRPGMMRLYKWAKDRNIRVVYDTDDALHLVEPWNPAYAVSHQNQDEWEYMAAHADAVTTTTPELASQLRRLNKNVVVVPNSVDPEEWQVRPRNRDSRLRIGWLGGSSHFLDLATAADALAELVKKLQFTFVIYGLTTMPSVQEFYDVQIRVEGERFRNSPLGKAVKVFLRKTKALPYDFKPFVPPSEYVATLCDLCFDIGIAPLADTPFNRNKSSIKYYEYGMSGAVTLASNVLPYSAEVPCLAANTKSAWKERISELVQSDLSQLWKSQRDWIMTHRNIETNVVIWEQVLSGSAQAFRQRIEEEIASPLLTY
jgi:glycosyltransferase involved in cell wall biosynthesis